MSKSFKDLDNYQYDLDSDEEPERKDFIGGYTLLFYPELQVAYLMIDNRNRTEVFCHPYNDEVLVDFSESMVLLGIEFISFVPKLDILNFAVQDSDLYNAITETLEILKKHAK